MTKKLGWCAAAVSAALLVGACDFPIEGGGGGLGPGGGLAGFRDGFVFVRSDDRNVYVADRSDYSTVALLTDSGDARQPSLSDNGRQVVFVSQLGSSSSLKVVPVAGGTATTVLASDSQRSNFANPVFSPDATKIAFSYLSGGTSYVGVVNTDGSGFVELGGGGPAMGSPSFYPDGQHVLVASGFSTGLNTLLKVNVSTGASETVLQGLGSEAMSIQNRVVISPSGTLAAFDGRISSGATRIFVANLGTGSVTRLTDYPGDTNANDSFPSWIGSTQVAFSNDSGGNDNVYGISPNAVKQTGSLLLPSAVEAWFGPN